MSLFRCHDSRRGGLQEEDEAPPKKSAAKEQMRCSQTCPQKQNEAPGMVECAITEAATTVSQSATKAGVHFQDCRRSLDCRSYALHDNMKTTI